MRAAAGLALCGLGVTLGVMLAGAASAREIVPAERRVEPFAAQFPSCFDPAVLEDITTAFAERETRFWRSER